MSALTALLAPWRRTALSRPTDGAAGAERVRLIAVPARAAGTPIERLLVDALASTESLPRATLVEQAAHALYRRELCDGGGLTDIGIFGPRLFVSDVRRTLEGARGVLWELEMVEDRRG